jgi:hypothetical protein
LIGGARVALQLRQEALVLGFKHLSLAMAGMTNSTML